MDRRNLSKALLLSATPALLLASGAEAQTCTAPCYARVDEENNPLITLADTQYPPGDGRRYGMVGDDSTDNSTALARLRSVAIKGLKCFIPKGVYRYQTSPNWAIGELHLAGERGTVLKHTGVGVAFNMDSGANGTYLFGLRIEDLILEGGIGTTDGLYSRGMAYSVFRNIEVRGCSDKAFHIKHGVANHYDTCQVNRSIGGVVFAAIPAYGFFLDNNGTGYYTADCTFTNCVAENFDGGLSGVGCRLQDASGNTFRGGTFESLATGLSISASSRHNHFESIWFEANATNDAIDRGVSNQFTNCHMASASSGNNFETFGTASTLTGGYCRVANLNAGSNDSLFIGVAFDNNSSNGIIGPGTFKNVGCVRVNGSYAFDRSELDRSALRGAFTVGLSGCSGFPTGTVFYSRVDDMVTLDFRLGVTGTSIATTATLTGMPSSLYPLNEQAVLARVIDGGVTGIGLVDIVPTGTIHLLKDVAGNVFTPSGVKGINRCTVTYHAGQ